METTLKWLKQYVEIPIGTAELEELLTMSGTEVEDMLPVRETGDTAFKFEITSNRTDCYSALGIAREIAALLGTEIKEPDLSYKTAGKNINDLTSVTVEAPELCPYYTAQLITGVKVGPSPKWLLDFIETLSSVKSIRPVNNVADITNYVLLEYSQPLHAFDFDKLKGKRLIVRRARKGEEIRAIDDKIYPLDENMCVIADEEKPQCVGGIMGGKESEITEQTTNILLESAYFDPMSIRRTSRKLGLASDSSYRFERGVDPEGIIKASRRCAKLIVENCGGEIHEGIIQVGKIEPYTHKITFRMPAIKRHLGIEVSAQNVLRIFKGLGLNVKITRENEIFEVNTPSFRRDLEREIDLVEEVGRITGYDKIPTKSRMPIKSVKPSNFEKLTDKLKDIAVGSGFTEVFTDSFVPDTAVYQANIANCKNLIRANNPVRSSEGLLRPSLFQSLLRVRKFNQDKGEPDARIFELARVFLGKEKGLPEEKYLLALTTSDYFQAKGVLEHILARLGIKYTIEPFSFALFEKQTGAKYRAENLDIAYLGKLDRKTQEQFDLQKEAAVLELDVRAALEKWDKVPAFKPLSKFPPMERELAIILENDKTWLELKKIVEQTAGELLKEIKFLEEYRGKHIPQGKKQYTFWMKFQHSERSLTSEEITELVENKIVGAIADKLGGQLRK